MNILTFDVETTTKEKGNPFHPDNKLCVAGFLFNDIYREFKIEYDGEPYGENLEAIRKLIIDADLIIGFNIKFDLHWLRKYGILEWNNKRIWDCQVAHFILTEQQSKYPSLNEVCTHYGLENKLDIIKTEYWDKSIDTPNIPLQTLYDYQRQDVLLTYQVYQKQREEAAQSGMGTLISLSCQDLIVLEEMEWNGQLYDKKESLRKSSELEVQLIKLDTELFKLVPYSFVNWNSSYHLSSILYGGTIEYTEQQPDGVYKTGKRTGEVKYKNVTLSKEFHRLVEPLKKSELAKEGYWSTDENALKQLKAKGLAKSIITLIQEKAKLEKANGTYFKGIPELMNKMGWEDDVIHGQLNQCVAVTGRLSSTKPNMQNFDRNMKNLFISRYK